jgi:K+-sensing histidine kinase KdpD
MKVRTMHDGTKINSAKDFAHKINTPLTTIMGYLAMVKMSVNTKEMDKKKTLGYMKKINSEITKITKYVKKIQKDLENV